MKKLLLTLFVVTIVLCSSGFSQVIADFEEGTNDFYDNGWGPGFNSVTQVADPSGGDGNVLALEYNSTNKGVIQKDNVDPLGGQILTYFVYLPADVPDSLSFKLWAQDKNTWSWTEVIYNAYNMPKEVWYPLNYNMEAMTVDPNVSFDSHNYEIGKMGVEIANWDEHDADTSWVGNIYIDNVSILGAEPVSFADFEIDENGFYDNGWGSGLDAVTKVDDPAGSGSGVLSLDYNGTNKGVIQKDNVTPSGQVMSFGIYLTADTPDSLSFKIWAQDKNTWSWTQVVYYVYEIPKEVWYPITYDMEAMYVNPDISFDYHGFDIGKMGIEIANWDEHDADTSWAGPIYFDNFEFLGIETGSKWVLADWESEAADPYFTVNGWGSVNNGISTFGRAADPTGNSDGVLLSTWNFIADSTNSKDAFSAAPVDLTTGATAICLDIFVPVDFPAGIDIEMWAQAHDWGWNSWQFPVSDSTIIVPGQWCTMTVDLVENAEALKLAEGNPKNFGVQIASTVDWTGDIYFDNYTVLGIEAPDAVLHTPLLQVSVTDTTFETGLPVQNARLTWDDSDQPGLETFDIYMSENAITDLSSDDVIKIATNVPHGEGHWNHRPWTPDGSEKSFYYAIIAKQAGEVTELTSEGTVGPAVFTQTSIPAHATYDPNFGSIFTLDGMDTEFTEEYKAHMMIPESASGDSSAGWSLESTDLMFHNTFVFDDDYLYISADVTDDDIVTEQGVSQAWKGDALEFYIGMYDISDIKEYHTVGSVLGEGTGDHRFSFTSYGTLELSGYIIVAEYKGIESVVYQKWGGDGYIIEARVPVDSLAGSGGFEVKKGAMLPIRIDNTDRDMSHGDESRTLLAGWGGSSGSDGGNHDNWKRPSCWGYLMIGEGDVAIDDDVAVAGEFKLHNNYPNPFNPTTNIKFQIAAHENVKLAIYDMLGNNVKTLVNEKRPVGVYNVQWDGTNDMGINVSTGVYFYKLSTKNHVATKKMLLMK